MLILNRKVGQSFLIANKIKVIILNEVGDIGIEAPKEMRILRSELLHHYRHPNRLPPLKNLQSEMIAYGSK
jgi:carbon storage regulator CsrA